MFTPRNGERMATEKKRLTSQVSAETQDTAAGKYKVWRERFLERLQSRDFRIFEDPLLAALLSDRDTLEHVIGMAHNYVCERSQGFAALRKARGQEMKRSLTTGLKGLRALEKVYEALGTEPKKQLCTEQVRDIQDQLSRVSEAYNAKRLGIGSDLVTLSIIDSFLKIRLGASSPATLALLLECGYLTEGRELEVDPENLRKQLLRFRDRNPTMAAMVNEYVERIIRR